MTEGPSIGWVGGDVVLLRGESVRRAYAALALGVRDHRHNGLSLPEDLVRDLAVLRRAAEHARAAVGEPDGFAGMTAEVSRPDAEVMDAVEVAAALGGKSLQYARRLCRHRFRTARLVDGEWRVSAAEVRAYVDARERSA